ncbi:MAG: nucleotidyltransferase domain-containing protein [Thermoanaerobaculia bacterium]
MDSIHPHVNVTYDQIAAFCRRWSIVRFELFGSVLRADFRDDSDVDVLVTFAEGTQRKIADWLGMEDEIMPMFERHVDLIERRLTEEERNPIRRRNILGSARSVYAAV